MDRRKACVSVLHVFPAQRYPRFLDEFTVSGNVVNARNFFVCVTSNSKSTVGGTVEAQQSLCTYIPSLRKIEVQGGWLFTQRLGSPPECQSGSLSYI